MIEKEFTIKTRVSKKGYNKGLTHGKLTFIGARYELSELEKFKNLYQKWIEYKAAGQFVHQRANLPEGLTEGLVSTHIPDVVRKMKINSNKSKFHVSKFDCYNPIKDEIIEVKGCSIPDDLTSWSPDPYFDVLYFVDFSKLDGSYDIYKIDTTDEELRNEKVSDTETFQQQIDKSRRPRFSVFEKYINQSYKCSGSPEYSGNLFTITHSVTVE